MKVEVAVQGSPSLIVLKVSVDVKQPLKKRKEESANGVLKRTCTSVQSEQDLEYNLL